MQAVVEDVQSKHDGHVVVLKVTLLNQRDSTKYVDHTGLPRHRQNHACTAYHGAYELSHVIRGVSRERARWSVRRRGAARGISATDATFAAARGL